MTRWRCWVGVFLLSLIFIFTPFYFSYRSKQNPCVRGACPHSRNAPTQGTLGQARAYLLDVRHDASLRLDVQLLDALNKLLLPLALWGMPTQRPQPTRQPRNPLSGHPPALAHTELSFSEVPGPPMAESTPAPASQVGNSGGTQSSVIARSKELRQEEPRTLRWVLCVCVCALSGERSSQHQLPRTRLGGKYQGTSVCG